MDSIEETDEVPKRGTAILDSSDDERTESRPPAAKKSKPWITFSESESEDDADKNAPAEPGVPTSSGNNATDDEDIQPAEAKIHYRVFSRIPTGMTHSEINYYEYQKNYERADTTDLAKKYTPYLTPYFFGSNSCVF